MAKPKSNPRRCERLGLQNHSCINTKHKDFATKTPPSKVVPIPGTALTALLKRYREDLLFCELSRELSLTLDCVDSLLMLVERGCHG